MERWNRFTHSTLRQEHKLANTKPYILNEPSSHRPNPIIFKQLQHLPSKYATPLYKLPKWHSPQSKEIWKDKKRAKNWLRRVKKRNKSKKPLPPLPAGTPGDLRFYYLQTYNINLFDYKVRRRFNVSSIPQYNYGYNQALRIFKRHMPCPRTTLIEDSTSKANNNSFYIISPDDHKIVNDSTFLIRIHNPDNTSYTTISDRSYHSALAGVSDDGINWDSRPLNVWRK